MTLRELRERSGRRGVRDRAFHLRVHVGEGARHGRPSRRRGQRENVHGRDGRKLNQRAREVWLNAKHTKEDEIFSLEKKKVGTK